VHTTAQATSARQGTADPALDEALAHIRELSTRLWEVRGAHRPARPSRLRRTPRCAGCGQLMPCPTLRAAG